MNLRAVRGKTWGRTMREVGGKGREKWHNYFLMKNFQILRESNRIKKATRNATYKSSK